MDRQELLAEVCVLIARTPEAEDAVEAITGLIAGYLDSWVFEVWLNRTGNALDLMARHVGDAVPARKREQLTFFSPRTGLADELPISHVARAGKSRTWAVDDRDLDPATRDNLATLEARELTVVPIKDNGTVLGVAAVTPPPAGPVTDADEEVMAVVLGNMAILLDRIHRREVEASRAHQMSLLKTAIESLPLVVKILSPDWMIRYVNPAVKEVLGYSPEELVDTSIERIRAATGPDSLQAGIAAAVPQGTWSGDVEDRDNQGRRVPVRLVVAPVRDAGGEMIGIIEIARDLSQEMEQERRAKDSYRMAVVGRLAAAVAHEVNNPLAAITMMTRVLLDDSLPEAVRKDLELINSEAHRAGGISRNLLVFARQSDVQKAPVDLEEVVREVVRLQRPELNLLEITVEVDAADDVQHVLGNPGQIRQVLHNLISNAAHAIQEWRDQGLIRVMITGIEDEWVELVVEDDGPGVAAAVIDRVMNPFFTTKAVGKGTGLGLSVCRDIVEAHGGEIRLENRGAPTAGGGAPGTSGARASIRLPATSAPGQRAEDRRSATPGAGAARVLIIDDDPAVASTLQRLVEKLGYSAEIEYRAEAAIKRILGNERFDAVLSDLKMPGVGGEGVYQAVERLRPDLLGSLVFMSGDLAPEADNTFLRRSSSATLEKPFTRDQLQQVLESVITRD